MALAAEPRPAVEFIRRHYPHMGPKESEIWTRFLLKTLTTEEGMSKEEALQVILNAAKIPERVIRWLGLLGEEPSRE